MIGVLPVYKRPGVRSFSIIRALKRMFPKVRIGHTGILDEFAEGVLVVLIGREYTKRVCEFSNGTKIYTATIRLGSHTDTLDSMGSVLYVSEVVPSMVDVCQVIDDFPMVYNQAAPSFSAKKINGKRFCDLARSGVHIEDRYSKVCIENLILDSYEFPLIKFSVTCFKGFYVRSLGRDICTRLGVYGHLEYLNRSVNCGFSIADCLDSEFINCDSSKNLIEDKLLRL